MATLKIVKTLTNNKYKVEAYMEGITANEQELIDDFGEPTVTIGGPSGLMDVSDASYFSGGYSVKTDADFTIVNQTKRLPSHIPITSPITYVFDANPVDQQVVQVSGLILAQAKAEDVADHIQHKINTAWDAFVLNLDTFSDTITDTLSSL